MSNPSKIRNIKEFFSGISEKILSVNADIDEDDEYDDDEVEVDNYHEGTPAPRYTAAQSAHSSAKKPNNVVRFNQDNLPQKSVEITDPANLEEASHVVDFLLRNVIVTVNLENIDKKDAQRVADFICGAAYAVNATIGRISNHIFIITPTGTGLSGGKKESDGDYSLPKVASFR
jgi:cell division inhibitor SepF